LGEIEVGSDKDGFKDDEWQAVYIVTTRQPPPETPPSIDEIIRMLV